MDLSENEQVRIAEKCHVNANQILISRYPQ